jgi:hypothetical protein
MNADGCIDVSDVIDVIAAGFSGGYDPQDPMCPTTRADVNNDGAVDVFDAIEAIHIAFTGGSSVDPCNPLPTGFKHKMGTRSTGAAPLRHIMADSRVVKGIPSQPSSADMANGITIESKTVEAGGSTTIGISIANDVSLRNVVIPLEIREVDPGSYFTALTLCRNPGGRLASFLTGISEFNTYPVPDGSCKTGYPGGYGMIAPPDYVSPDGALFSVGKIFGSDPSLPPGVDPPSGSLQLLMTVNGTVGDFEIDTTCADPCNHLVLVQDVTNTKIVPAFTKGVVHIVPSSHYLDCSRSTTDPYLLACPLGDIPFQVNLRSNLGTPWPGGNVRLDFSGCPSPQITPLPGAYPSWPIVYGASASDDSGIVRFSIAAGSDCPDCVVRVYADCGLIATVPVRSTDITGDNWVTPADYDDAEGMCRDLTADGRVDWRDLSRHSNHLNHRFPGNTCDRLIQKIETVPDAGFGPGDTIKVRWSVTNTNPSTACVIQIVNLYSGILSTAPSWTIFGSFNPNISLPPGGVYTDSILKFAVPSYGKMCLRSLLVSGCCSTPQEEISCIDIARQCPPGPVCYHFKAVNVQPANDTSISVALPEGLGWTYQFDSSGTFAETLLVTICTSDISPIGTSGGVTLTFEYDTVYDTTFKPINFAVRQDWNNGDLCGGAEGDVDCTVDVFDIICLIDYVFSGGPAPEPPEHADLNCDGVQDVFDIIYLIDYVFSGGPLPPECGAGPMATRSGGDDSPGSTGDAAGYDIGPR